MYYYFVIMYSLYDFSRDHTKVYASKKRKRIRKTNRTPKKRNDNKNISNIERYCTKVAWTLHRSFIGINKKKFSYSVSVLNKTGEKSCSAKGIDRDREREYTHENLNSIILHKILCVCIAACFAYLLRRRPLAC